MSPLPPGHKESHSKSLALCGLRERPLEFIWLYVFPYVLHRDVRWFTEPDLFDPARFAPEKCGALQRAAYSQPPGPLSPSPAGRRIALTNLAGNWGPRRGFRHA